MFNINFDPWGSSGITAQQAIDDQSNVFKSVFGLFPNLYPSSPTGAFIQELADQEINVNNTCLYITSNVYGLSTSQGIFLDGIGNLFGIKRTPSTKTIVSCQLSGLPNLVVPPNSIVSDGENQFVNMFAVSFGSTGVGVGNFICTQTGQLDIPANSVTTIITPITGWSSVTNAVAGFSGKNIQNDTSFRFTLQYSQSINGKSFIESLYAIFSNFIAQDGSSTVDAYGINVPYIQGFYIYSNYKSTSQTLVPSTTPIPVGGIYITLYAPQYLSPTNPDLNKNLQYIAGIILQQSGANTTNNIQTGANAFNVDYVNTSYPEIDDVNVKFDSPIATPISISFTLTLYNKSTNQSSLQLAIQQAILSQFYNGYSNDNVIYPPARMNAAINTADFIAAIVNIAGACTITYQDIELVTGGTPSTSLLLTIDKVATLSLNNINIVLS